MQGFHQLNNLKGNFAITGLIVLTLTGIYCIVRKSDLQPKSWNQFVVLLQILGVETPTFGSTGPADGTGKGH